MKKEKLKNILEQSLQIFYKKDANKLLKIKGTERACVFRIGIYMQELMNNDSDLKNFNLDCEYNKLGDTPKKIYTWSDKNKVQPDIIIHKRETKGNLMVAEFKGHWNTGIDNDINKLEYFTKQNSKNEYKYQLGALVVLNIGYADVRYFINGEKEKTAILEAYKYEKI